MTSRILSISITALLGVAAVASASASAQALTMKECSVKYKAAQTAGTLKGMKWNDFRKAECGTEASATPTSVSPASKPASAPFQVPSKPATTTTTRPSVPSAMPTNAVFPNAVDQKYSKESAGKARMHTCLDQDNANKASNGNGGLKWIVKGGGYYSECNKRLKG